MMMMEERRRMIDQELYREVGLAVQILHDIYRSNAFLNMTNRQYLRNNSMNDSTYNFTIILNLF